MTGLIELHQFLFSAVVSHSGTDTGRSVHALGERYDDTCGDRRTVRRTDSARIAGHPDGEPNLQSLAIQAELKIRSDI